jgi:hypothetical protein
MEYIYDSTIMVYDKGKKRILKLLDSGFNEEAIILTVTICEVLLKDFCKTCKGVWIHHAYGHSIQGLGIKKTHEAKVRIRKYLTPANAYDNFLKSYYVHQGGYSEDPDREALYEVLFENDRFLNFQNLKDNEAKGARKAYEFFFDIDLRGSLDSDRESSHRRWVQLQRLIEERHNIIHTGSDSTMTTVDIREVISSLDYLKEFLTNKIRSYYPLQDF